MKKPKFIKEIEKSEWKERAKCWRWYIRVYWELDHKPMVELESLEIIVKELHKLEEEVRFLEECLDRKEKLNEEYRKEIDKYKRQYEHSMWEDDELIYEEWLYD